MGNKIVTNKNFDIIPTNKPISGYTAVICFKGDTLMKLMASRQIFLAKIEVPANAIVVKPKGLQGLNERMSKINEHRTNKLTITNIISFDSSYQQCRTTNFTCFDHNQGDTHEESLSCDTPEEVNEEGTIFMLDRKYAEDWVLTMP